MPGPVGAVPPPMLTAGAGDDHGYDAPAAAWIPNLAAEMPTYSACETINTNITVLLDKARADALPKHPYRTAHEIFTRQNGFRVRRRTSSWQPSALGHQACNVPDLSSLPAPHMALRQAQVKATEASDLNLTRGLEVLLLAKVKGSRLAARNDAAIAGQTVYERYAWKQSRRVSTLDRVDAIAQDAYQYAHPEELDQQWQPQQGGEEDGQAPAGRGRRKGRGAPKPAPAWKRLHERARAKQLLQQQAAAAMAGGRGLHYQSAAARTGGVQSPQVLQQPAMASPPPPQASAAVLQPPFRARRSRFAALPRAYQLEGADPHQHVPVHAHLAAAAAGLEYGVLQGGVSKAPRVSQSLVPTPPPRRRTLLDIQASYAEGQEALAAAADLDGHEGARTAAGGGETEGQQAHAGEGDVTGQPPSTWLASLTTLMNDLQTSTREAMDPYLRQYAEARASRARAASHAHASHGHGTHGASQSPSRPSPYSHYYAGGAGTGRSRRTTRNSMGGAGAAGGASRRTTRNSLGGGWGVGVGGSRRTTRNDSDGGAADGIAAAAAAAVAWANSMGLGSGGTFASSAAVRRVTLEQPYSPQLERLSGPGLGGARRRRVQGRSRAGGALKAASGGSEDNEEEEEEEEGSGGEGEEEEEGACSDAGTYVSPNAMPIYSHPHAHLPSRFVHGVERGIHDDHEEEEEGEGMRVATSGGGGSSSSACDCASDGGRATSAASSYAPSSRSNASSSGGGAARHAYEVATAAEAADGAADIGARINAGLGSLLPQLIRPGKQDQPRARTQHAPPRAAAHAASAKKDSTSLLAPAPMAAEPQAASDGVLGTKGRLPALRMTRAQRLANSRRQLARDASHKATTCLAASINAIGGADQGDEGEASGTAAAVAVRPAFPVVTDQGDSAAALSMWRGRGLPHGGLGSLGVGRGMGASATALRLPPTSAALN